MSDYENPEALSATMALGMISQHNRRFIKKLKASDVNDLCRLMLNGEFVENCVLPSIDPAKARLSQSPQGAEFRVWDANDGTFHFLYLRKYSRKHPYVLNVNWRLNFVQRKGLTEGDKLAISFFDGTFIIDLLPRN